MKARGKSGFLLSSNQISNNIVVPRYYDPRIKQELESLEDNYHLLTIGELVKSGYLEHSHGSYVPKMHYGSGPFPYVRTSDITNWEIKASPKHGVSAEVFETFNIEQDVRVGDILFVHEGTYLIGAAAMVTEQDGPILYQHHLAKFRVTDKAPFNRYYFLAALASPIVQRQIRARQFSADIIDSVVGRLEEITVPISKSISDREAISSVAQQAIEERSKLRSQLTTFLAALEPLLRTGDVSAIKRQISESGAFGGQTFLGDREAFIAFKKPIGELVEDIFIPKYYSPRIGRELADFKLTCRLASIQDLVDEGLLELSTGDEIGRLNYGGGAIPFVRTSDLGSFELKADSKHGVDEGVWAMFQKKQDIRPGDILLVRDGTYLVGSTSLIFDEDLPLLYCGGIYKLRFTKPEVLPSALGYALLNTPILKRQMRSKQFTRDVIDTLGQRLREVIVPIPYKSDISKIIAEFVNASCRDRVLHREKLSKLCKYLFTNNQPSIN